MEAEKLYKTFLSRLKMQDRHINAYWSRLLTIGLDDIIKNKEDISKFKTEISAVETIIYKVKQLITGTYNEYKGDYDKVEWHHNKLDEYCQTLLHKTYIISQVLDPLYKIQENIENIKLENTHGSIFDDNTFDNIEESVNYIKLTRFIK